MAKTKLTRKLIQLSKLFTYDQCKRLLECTPQYLVLIGYGHKEPGAALATRIEMVTDGIITRQVLRADWKEIWPELINGKAAKVPVKDKDGELARIRQALSEIKD